MTKEIKQLLIDCANFIQPYDDGGNEAERLMIRLDEALKKDKNNVQDDSDMGSKADELIRKKIRNIYRLDVN